MPNPPTAVVPTITAETQSTSDERDDHGPAL